MRTRLAAQSADERLRRSRLIRERLFAEPRFRIARCIAFYVSMPQEVDTTVMIDKALVNGLRVVVPRCRMDTLELSLHEISSRKTLQVSSFGIAEPDPDQHALVDASAIDCVIVPGVAFDRQGNRIGNGKGFYDRFLKKVPPSAFKAGLAFAFQLVDAVPTDAHDVRLDAVITDAD